MHTSYLQVGQCMTVSTGQGLEGQLRCHLGCDYSWSLEFYSKFTLVVGKIKSISAERLRSLVYCQL